jgi:Zn-dependent M28 family amino/carboxypeptidase
LRDEWVILSAHYDHLGVRNGVLYPGADDNASGVAMMLEVARSLVEAPQKSRRSLMLVSFDLEENGLFGSRYFVDHPPIPLDKVKLFITADLIGRSLGGVCGSFVFVMGTERAPEIRPWIDQAAAGRPITLGILGSDILLIDRSDYGPFRASKIPYLFFSTGENPRYHSPDDTPDTLDYPKLEAISRTIARVVRAVADAESLPAWHKTPDNPLSEAVAIREVMKTLLDHRETLKIDPLLASLMGRTVAQLDAIIARGAMTSSERTRIVLVAQLVLSKVL